MPLLRRSYMGGKKWLGAVEALLETIARFIVPKNRTLAVFLSSIPMLRTHLLGLLFKK